MVTFFNLNCESLFNFLFHKTTNTATTNVQVATFWSWPINGWNSRLVSNNVKYIPQVTSCFWLQMNLKIRNVHIVVKICFSLQLCTPVWFLLVQIMMMNACTTQEDNRSENIKTNKEKECHLWVVHASIPLEGKFLKLQIKLHVFFPVTSYWSSGKQWEAVMDKAHFWENTYTLYIMHVKIIQ